MNEILINIGYYPSSPIPQKEQSCSGTGTVDKGKRLMKFLAPLISLETLFNGEAQTFDSMSVIYTS